MKYYYIYTSFTGLFLPIFELLDKLWKPITALYVLGLAVVCFHVQDFWFCIAAILLLLFIALFVQNVQLFMFANKDLLTGLGNKNSLNVVLEREASRVSRNGGFLVVLFVDIDNFKRINDTLGHKTGDGVLVEVARRIKEQKRNYDALIRYGGDEFCIICSQVQKEEDGFRIRDHLQDVLHFCHFTESGDVQVQASCGMATYPTDTEDLKQLIAMADRKMYEQKERRKLARMGNL